MVASTQPLVSHAELQKHNRKWIVEANNSNLCAVRVLEYFDIYIPGSGLIDDLPVITI